MCTTPQCLPLAPDSINLEGIRKMCGGGGHLMILDDAGRLFACGWNGKGQLGLCDTVDSHVVKALPKLQAPIVDIACGWDSTAAIDASGNLYVWGSNAFNQLGFSANFIDTKFTIPMLLNLPVNEKVTKVSFGLRYMCILCENRTIYIVGRWRAQENCKVIWHNDVNFYELMMPSSDLHVDDIASGSNHIVCKCVDRTTMTAVIVGFGDNKFLQCSQQQFNGITVRCVRSGWSNNGILTGNGLVYLWGRNTYGQCGAAAAAADNSNAGDKIDTMIQLQGIQRSIEQLHLGSEHGLIVTDHGEIFTWGWNEHGNCGNGTETNLYVVTTKNACVQKSD